MNEVLAPGDGSLWLRSELKNAGHSDRDIAALVAGGVLRRLRRGAYADAPAFDAADASGRHRLLARAAVKQAKTRVIVSHTSAVPFHDGPIWRLPMNEVQLSRPDGRAGRAQAGIRQHQRLVQPDDVVIRHGLEVMSATRTALEVTTCASTEVSLIVVNDFLHRRLTTVLDLQQRYAAMCHDPYTLKTDLVLRLADPRLESPAETRTWFMCYRHGVPAPTPQYQLRDEIGDLIARLDFAWPELGVWLEVDGRQKYVKYLREGESVVDVVLREKERESMIAEITGWRCIRITWVDLADPEATVARIIRLLGVTPRVPSVTR
jgi:hypothetical protein